MSDAIGPDGLTHKERVFRNTIDGMARVAQAIGAESPFDAAAHAIVEALAAERLAHAETRARAESMHVTLANLRDCVRNLEADRNAAIEMLTAGGVALGVHSASSMREHAAAVNLQVRDLQARAEKAEAEGDRLRAALEDIAGRLHVDGGHDLWARAQSEPCTCVMHVAARALLGEVKP